MALLSASLTVRPGLDDKEVWPWSPRCALTIVRTGDLGTLPELGPEEDDP